MHRQADLAEIIGALGRRAVSRAACTAGKRMAISTATIPITTSNSINVNPRCSGACQIFLFRPIGST